MGLLNSNTLNNYLTQTIPQNARNIWDAVKRAPSDIGRLFDGSMSPALTAAMSGKGQKANPEQWMNAGMELSGMAPVGGLLAHTVYHGSPHKFDKFDMSKIGTGEGAQAYGHGLYFAENPGVARSYQQGLSQSSPRVMTWKGQQIGFDDLKSVAEQYANNLPAEQRSFALDSMTRMLRDQSGYGTPKFYDQLKQVKSKITKNLKQANVLKGSQYDNPSTRQWYEQFKTMLDDIQVEYPGNFYKVDIPDEAIPRMLDWDKPISQQTPEVQEMLAAAKLTADNPDFAFWSKAYGKQYELGKPPEMTGGALVQALSNSGKAAAGARDLKSLGIPGIRYLDQASRGSNKGTSNFVLFDDQLPRILEINGQPTGLLSWADEAAQKGKGLLGVGDNVPMRVIYRGTNNSGEKIKGGISEGDLFAATKEKVAKSYAGSDGVIEKIAIKPNARILVEGSAEYAKLTGRRKGKLINTMRKGENLKTAADDVAKRAKEAGYDAVEFTSMDDMGIAIFNPDKFIRNYKGEK